MQIDEKEETNQGDITFEDTIVNIDYAISKLRHHNRENARFNRNPWPETAYIFRESAVLSSQLWLHNIEFCRLSITCEILNRYQKEYSMDNFNNQIIQFHNFDLDLNIIIKSESKWINNNIFFDIKQLTVFDYIKYLSPLIEITKHSIISTIIARTKFTNYNLFESEIVSIGEFRPFHTNNNCRDWRYRKETQEIARNIEFQFFHYYDLFKAINYQVRQRIILQLSKLVFLEIVIVKENYFEDIKKYYSGQNQLLITPIDIEFPINQPHQTDRFDTVEHIITEYYPQQ